LSLLTPADQQRLRDAFAEMTRPVRLLFFTQTLDCETCLTTRQILDELPPLSERISIEEVNVVLDVDRAKQYGIDRAPGVAVVFEGEASNGGSAPLVDTRIRFVGAPSGYEFMSLVAAVLLAGGRASSLTPENLARLAAVDKPVTMQVFTTPS
jgi:alkyl hydroperoxide reductase subunit AhpF